MSNVIVTRENVGNGPENKTRLFIISVAEFVAAGDPTGIAPFRRKRFRARRGVVRVPRSVAVQQFDQTEHSVRFADGRRTLQTSKTIGHKTKRAVVIVVLDFEGREICFQIYCVC